MAIEHELEKIAYALERIADHLDGSVPYTNLESGARPRFWYTAENMNKDFNRSPEAEAPEVEAPTTEAPTTEAPTTEAPKTRPGKKVEEKPIDEPPEEEEFEDIKWPDVNKKLFGMLNAVRDTEGNEEAKATCAVFMAKYSGGQKFSPGAVAPKSYKALLADIEARLEELTNG